MKIKNTYITTYIITFIQYFNMFKIVHFKRCFRKKIQILQELVSDCYWLSINTTRVRQENVTIARLNAQFNVKWLVLFFHFLLYFLSSIFRVTVCLFDSHSFPVRRPEGLMKKRAAMSGEGKNKTKDRGRMKFLVCRDVAQFRGNTSSNGTVPEILYLSEM